METLGSFDLDTSLFNGDLQWVGLPSPVEVEPPSLPGHVGPPLKRVAGPLNADGLHKSGSHDTVTVSLLDQGQDAGLLDLPQWLDTNVDLSDLLRESSEQLALSHAETTFPPLAVPSIGAQAADQTIVTPVTAEDLFNSIQSGRAVRHVASFEAPVVTDADGDMLLQVLNKLTDDLDPSVDSHLTSLTAAESVLSPVSAEDVESVLSYPGSPMDALSDADNSIESLMDDPDYLPDTSLTEGPKASGSGSRKRKSISGIGDEVKDKKLRKKMQNKTAALRYRQKKKSEQSILDEDVTSLETKNKELKDKVAGMTQEIKYLKNLMAEVYTAKQNKARQA